MKEIYCGVCKKKIYRGLKRQSLVIRSCYVCKIPLCGSCIKKGFCPNHYSIVSEHIRKKIKYSTILIMTITTVIAIGVFSFVFFGLLALVFDYLPDIPEGTILDDWQFLKFLLVAFPPLVVLYGFIYVSILIDRHFADKILNKYGIDS
ncbi:MAG: hypothetical protein ACTSWC_07865 [Promethearchaeota archaeon]